MNTIFKIVIIISLGLNSSFVLAQENSFLRGQAYFEKNEFKQANDYLSIHLSNFPKNQEARILRAKASLSFANYSQALEDLSYVKSSKNTEVLLLEARANAGMGNNKIVFEKLSQYSLGSNKIAEEIIKAYPEFVMLKSSKEWMDLWKNWKYSEKEMSLIDIRYAIKSDRKEEAADRLDLFLGKFKSNSEAYYLRGKLFSEKKDYKDALQNFEQAFAMDNSSDYQIERAKTLHMLGHNKKALEDYNQVLSSDSLLINAYLGRSEVYLSLGDYNHALEDITKYRIYYPENSNAQYVEAQVESKSGDYLSAIGNFGRLIKVNPARPEFFIGRADAYSETKTYAYAIKDYSMALDLDPKNVDVYKKKAKMHELMGDMKSACYDWNHAASLGDIESLNNSKKYCK
jgi:tetratricopeptide (TPR) repeat protein